LPAIVIGLSCIDNIDAYIAPSGLDLFMAIFPGRCPGLS
jgi:hypothetical protein